ncbi:MAG: hypothetical protein CL908_25795 [Deltaproteobacteria bacterium]|nr:hypothetical protein [Deltaproteobacteria bacterium]
MIRVLLLLAAVFVAIVVAAVANWDMLTGEDPHRKSGRTSSTEQAPDLPDIRMERVPIHSVIGTAASGPRANVTKAVADALQVLAVEGKVDLTKIATIGRTQKVPIDVLTALPDGEIFTTADIEKLGESGKVDKVHTKTVARDNQVHVEVIKALVADGRVPSKFGAPFEVLGNAGQLPMDELEVDTEQDRLVIQTIRLVEAGRLVRGLEIHDSQGNHLKVAFDPRTGQWSMPDRFDAPVLQDRMKAVCRAVDGLGAASPRGAVTARHKKYEVDGDDGARITFLDEQDLVITALRVGKQDMSGGRTFRSAGHFVRPVGSKFVYRHGTRLNMVTNAQARVWLDLRFLAVDYQEVTGMLEGLAKINLEYDDIQMGPKQPQANLPEPTGDRVRFVLECREVKKDKVDPGTGPAPAPTGDESETERKWFVLEPAASKDLDTYLPGVDSVARMILNGRKENILGTDFTKPEYGLDKPVLVFTLSLKDERSFTLTVGAQVPVEGEAPAHQARSRYATISGSPFVMGLSEYTVKGLMAKLSNFEDPNKRTAANPAIRPQPPGAPTKPELIAPDDPRRKAIEDAERKARLDAEKLKAARKKAEEADAKPPTKPTPDKSGKKTPEKAPVKKAPEKAPVKKAPAKTPVKKAPVKKG